MSRDAEKVAFEYDAPDQLTTFPRNSDWSGHHVAFYVSEIDAAVAHLVANGVEKLLDPLAVTDGPAAGQTINYFRAPFGTYIELISYPKGMASSSWSQLRSGIRATAVPRPIVHSERTEPTRGWRRSCPSLRKTPGNLTFGIYEGYFRKPLTLLFTKHFSYVSAYNATTIRSDVDDKRRGTTC